MLLTLTRRLPPSPTLIAVVAWSAACGGSSGEADVLAIEAPEPPGDNCALGGTRVDVGIDEDEDGTLGAGEVTDTTFVCDEPDDPAVVLVERGERVFENAFGCVHGYQLIQVGADDGESAGDGVLQADEVRETLTVCLAADVDEDGSTNLVDNCPEDANPGQEDRDLDGNGDACDTTNDEVVLLGFTRGTGNAPSVLVRLDPVTFEGTQIGSIGHSLTNLKVNPSDGVLYGITRGDDAGECDNCLVTVDPTSGAGTEVIALDGGPHASMAFLEDGTLHTWTESEDVFTRVNVGDGTLTTLGDYIDSYAHGMCATSADEVYWINGNGATYLLDPTDGAATFIGSTASTAADAGWTPPFKDHGVRGGDCERNSRVYLGVEATFGDDELPSRVITLVHTPDGPIVRAVDTTDVPQLHGIAIVRP